jgi:hypothetical protein
MSRLRYGFLILALAYLFINNYLIAPKGYPGAERLARFAALCAIPLPVDFVWSWLSAGWKIGHGPPKTFEMISFALIIVSLVCAVIAESDMPKYRR